jgi:hypothetical protein
VAYQKKLASPIGIEREMNIYLLRRTTTGQSSRTICITPQTLLPMARLLQIEAEFLTQVSAFNYSRLQDLQTAERDARKAQFENSLKFGAEASKALAWYKSPEGKEAMEASGVEWPTIKDFVQKVFGYKTTSRLYKVVKAADNAAEAPEMLTAFKRECTRLEREGEKAERSVEGWNKYFANGGAFPAAAEAEADGEGTEGDGEGAEGTASADPTFYLQFTRKKTDMAKGFNVRMDTECNIEVSGNIRQVLAELDAMRVLLQGLANAEAEAELERALAQSVAEVDARADVEAAALAGMLEENGII